MKRDRAKLANERTGTVHYNTRSSSRRNGSSATISDADRVETSEAIMESTSASVRITRRRKKISDDRRTRSVLLPIDLIIEVFKRLPVKSLARFLSLSKHWASIIRSPNFMKLFQSWNRPCSLFFTLKLLGEDSFFVSSLQTRNPGEASVATYHIPPPAYDRRKNSSYVHGLICYETACGSGLAVYNSNTRRSILLPKFEPGRLVIKHILGYDPVDHVYKVMCITGPKLVSQVLTLGNENENSWKMIEFSHTHYPCGSQIYINGVVYYGAGGNVEPAVMSFDVRSEKFDLIEGPDDYRSTPLYRYKGKLATMFSIVPDDGVIALWVLEDAVKREWLKKVFVLPNSWRRLARGKRTSLHWFHRFVYVTDAGELILAPVYLRLPRLQYYVLCYDPERNSVTRIEIGGITEHKHKLLGFKKRKFFLVTPIFSSPGESLMFL